MSNRKDYSKHIIKILGENKAVKSEEIQNPSALRAPSLVKEGNATQNSKYAIARSLKNLFETGMIESISSGQNEYLKLTKAGRMKASSQKLEARSSLVNLNWDGFWRIVLLDLPEERKRERESLRYLLKKAGFVCLKNSVWITPYPFEHLFINIKKDLNLTTELIVLVTSQIDEETEKVLSGIFGK